MLRLIFLSLMFLFVIGASEPPCRMVGKLDAEMQQVRLELDQVKQELSVLKEKDKDEFRSCRVRVLSVDHASGITGQYFNFDRASIRGLSKSTDVRFSAFNPRTGMGGEVVLWPSANGGSNGDSHGRFNSKPIHPAAGQWKTGDFLVPMDNYFCMRQADEFRSCRIRVLSVDHASGITGQYFNFDRASIKGLSNSKDVRFSAFNPRTGMGGEVVLWPSANGGSNGDSHGRFNRKPIHPAAGQWKTGDFLVPMDNYFCEKACHC